MDLIQPVTTALFPYQRNMRRDEGVFATAFAQVEEKAASAQVSMRPSQPLANVGMMIQIMSAAGEPMNSNDIRKNEARKNILAFHRRVEDYAAGMVPDSQPAFSFLD